MLFSGRSPRDKSVKKAAEHNDLLYIGGVTAQDDYEAIRGFTASSQQQDSSLAIGEVEGYPITIVNRTIKHQGARNEQWLIAAMKLQTAQIVPYIFVKPVGHNDASYVRLFILFPALIPVDFDTFEAPNPDFMTKYTAYASPAHIIQAEKLFPASVGRVVAEYLWPFAFEISNNTVYMYLSSDTVSPGDINRLIEGCLWLAKHTDYQIELI